MLKIFAIIGIIILIIIILLSLLILFLEIGENGYNDKCANAHSCPASVRCNACSKKDCNCFEPKE